MNCNFVPLIVIHVSVIQTTYTHHSLYNEHLYSCTFRHLSNQPNIWQQWKTNHADTGQELPLMVTSNIRMIKKCDLDRSRDVGTKRLD